MYTFLSVCHDVVLNVPTGFCVATLVCIAGSISQEGSCMKQMEIKGSINILQWRPVGTPQNGPLHIYSAVLDIMRHAYVHITNFPDLKIIFTITIVHFLNAEIIAGTPYEKHPAY